MAFNGSGVFVRLYSWVAQQTAGFKIDSVKMDAEDNGFATGLSQCITTNGQSLVTADTPWNNNKITGVKDPVALQDAVTLNAMTNAIALVANATQTTVPLASVDVTLTAAQAAATVLNTNGVLLTNVNVIYPAGLVGIKRVGNSCTGAFNVTIKNGAGDGGVVVAQSLRTPVLLNGTHATLDTFAGYHNGSGGLPSSATTDLGGVPQGILAITGTTAITSFGSSAAVGETRILRFASALTLTHNGASLILPGGANITTAANDVAIATQFSVGNWSVVYFPASGFPIATSGSYVPPGAIVQFAANVPPTGYLELKGQLVSRTTFAALWAAAQAGGLFVADATWLAGGVDGSFSTGDTTTTFRLPDFRGYFLRGWDDGRGVDAGRVSGTNQTDAVGPHTHATATASVSVVANSSTNPYSGTGANSTGAVNSGLTAAENRPKNITVLFCIKT